MVDTTAASPGRRHDRRAGRRRRRRAGRCRRRGGRSHRRPGRGNRRDRRRRLRRPAGANDESEESGDHGHHRGQAATAPTAAAATATTTARAATTTTTARAAAIRTTAARARRAATSRREDSHPYRPRWSPPDHRCDGGLPAHARVHGGSVERNVAHERELLVADDWRRCALGRTGGPQPPPPADDVQRGALPHRRAPCARRGRPSAALDNRREASAHACARGLRRLRGSGTGLGGGGTCPPAGHRAVAGRSARAAAISARAGNKLLVAAGKILR